MAVQPIPEGYHTSPRTSPSRAPRRRSLDHVRELRDRVERHLRERVGCSLPVTLEVPGTVPRSEGGKLQRVLDQRALR
jgi:phenylacetate-coenzyme A ligase PaaK-like adenylate-forming protein